MDGEQWYAIYVRSRYDRAVESALQGKGYRAFSPVYAVGSPAASSPPPGRVARAGSPIFPGYVFCQFDASRRLPILTTNGVVLVVGNGKNPEPILEREIASLRKAMACPGALRPWPFLQEGQRVRVESGPLAGAEGELLQVKGGARLIVSITLLQRSLAVELDSAGVAPVCRTVNYPVN